MSLWSRLFRRQSPCQNDETPALAAEPQQEGEVNSETLNARYGGRFHPRGRYVYDGEGRFRGFYFSEQYTDEKAMQARAVAAKHEGIISDNFATLLFVYIDQQDFMSKLIEKGELIVFPSDIYD